MRLHKKTLFLTLATSLLVACSGGNTTESESTSGAPSLTSNNHGAIQKVAITAIVEHPALDAIHKGIVDELKANGYEDGKNIQIIYQSAQGNTATAGQIAKKFVGDKPDVIVAISTPSAQPIAAATKKIPIVFSGIADPIAAKLVSSWSPSKTNITGVSNMLPIDSQVKLVQQLVPNLKNLGFVYSPGEINSTAIKSSLEQALLPLHLNLVAAPATRTSDITEAARSLKGKVDAIYTSTDNNVVSAYESLYKVAVENKIPLIASDPDSVRRGAVAALGVNFEQMGHQTGQMVIKILNGTPAGDIAPEKMAKLELAINKKSAKLMGVTIPAELEKEASIVIE